MGSALHSEGTVGPGPCVLAGSERIHMPMDFENVGPARQGKEYKSVSGELSNVGAQSCDWAGRGGGWG